MENYIPTENNPINQGSQRPQFLTVLCVLSFIWSGLLLFCLFIGLTLSDFIFNTAEKLLIGMDGMPPISEEQQKSIQTLLDLGPQKFLMIIAVAIILAMTSLLGAIKMWKFQKWGFYVYATVNSLYIVYDIVSGSYFSVIITLAFIVMYFANLKHMK